MRSAPAIGALLLLLASPPARAAGADLELITTTVAGGEVSIAISPIPEAGATCADAILGIEASLPAEGIVPERAPAGGLPSGYHPTGVRAVRITSDGAAVEESYRWYLCHAAGALHWVVVRAAHPVPADDLHPILAEIGDRLAARWSAAPRRLHEIDAAVRFVRAADPGPLDGFRHATSVQVRFRVLGRQPWTWVSTADLELGIGNHGVLYDVDWRFGAVRRWHTRSAIGLVAGLGFAGIAAGYIPFGYDVPVELFAATDLDDALRVRLAGRLAGVWEPETDQRQATLPGLPFANELQLEVSLQWLRRERREAAMLSRDGVALGAFYQERMGVRFIGASLAWTGVVLE